MNLFIDLYDKNHQTIYQMAKTKSIQLDRPLVVFGDPYYGKGSRFLQFIYGRIWLW
jgi:hypothetical protein